MRVLRSNLHSIVAQWKLLAALSVTTAVCLGGYSTRQTWLRVGAESLVCVSSEVPSEAILIDHVEDNYLLFERAQQLQARGAAPMVLVPILSSESNGRPNAVSLGFVELMCRISQIPRCITFHAPSNEPISLNLARHSKRELEARGIKSVVIVTDGFRSRRSLAVYDSILGSSGIAVRCQPVFGSHGPANWFESYHGIQDVMLQFVKFWYYRLFVKSPTSALRVNGD